jgi:hypothetical protein
VFWSFRHYEETGTKEAREAEEDEAAADGESEEDESTDEPPTAIKGTRKPTRHLIQRAVQRLIRAGGRKTEAEAAHLLEGIAVVVYDPETGMMDPDLPPPASGLRWDEFVNTLATTYQARFEG